MSIQEKSSGTTKRRWLRWVGIALLAIIIIALTVVNLYFALHRIEPTQQPPTPTASHAPEPSQKVIENVPLRIMVLGGSTAYGQTSFDGNGYRGYLRDMLVANNKTVNYVGSERNGSMIDNDIEAQTGAPIDMILGRARSSVPKSKPNIIMVNAGMNDCLQFIDIPNAGNRLEAMLNFLWATVPNATLITANLQVAGFAQTEQCVQSLNAQYDALVKKLRAAGKPIVYADMHSVLGPTPEELVDGCHPNANGYNKMAHIWYYSLQEADLRGWIQKAPVLAIPDDGNAPRPTTTGPTSSPTPSSG